MTGVLSHFKARISAVLKQTRIRRESGSIAVEYALCIILATLLMTGVQRLFTIAISDVVHRAMGIVSSFPNI
jgi:Flp pilus assembly pilin Flp